MVAAITPSVAADQFKALKRAAKRKQVNEFIKNKGVPIIRYTGNAKPGLLVKFAPYSVLKAAATLHEDQDRWYDILWLSGWLLSSKEIRHPNWSGFMQHALSARTGYSKSTVLMLPIIDLQPSDPTCIYSTLKFIESQARNLGVISHCITFDQPLWYKATAIIHEMKLNIGMSSRWVSSTYELPG